MNDAGKIAIRPRGEYNNSTLYEFLDLVTYDYATWICKKASQGNIPSKNSEYWQWMCAAPDVDDIITKDDIATTDKLGIVKPDDETITIDGNGILSAVTESLISHRIILDEENWDNETKEYIILDANITEQVNGFIVADKGATIEQYNLLSSSCITIKSQENGKLTLKANNTIPSGNIPIDLLIFKKGDAT